MLEIVTEGELNVLLRRRSGHTQVTQAIVLCNTLVFYRAAEKETTIHSEPVLITEPEYCFLLRKRAGLTQQSVAYSLGKSRWWVNQMERGLADCTELLKYWEDRNGRNTNIV